jgi:Fe-S cluster assembly ATP-binding protein
MTQHVSTNSTQPSRIVRFELTSVSASVQGHPALFDVSLTLALDEPTAILGPNGSGKSTLLKLLAGSPDVVLTSGHILAVRSDGTSFDWSSLDAHSRAHAGLFLAWQHPPALPGLPVQSYLRAVVNAQRTARQLPLLDPFDFEDLALQSCSNLGLSTDFLSRHVHVGFSGGELKKSEMLQADLLKPDWFFCDEIESGVDVDAQRQLLSFWHTRLSQGFGLVVVSHQFSLLAQVPFRHILVLSNGRVIRDASSIDFQMLQKDGFSSLTASERSAS